MCNGTHPALDPIKQPAVNPKYIRHATRYTNPISSLAHIYSSRPQYQDAIAKHIIDISNKIHARMHMRCVRKRVRWPWSSPPSRHNKTPIILLKTRIVMHISILTALLLNSPLMRTSPNTYEASSHAASAGEHATRRATHSTRRCASRTATGVAENVQCRYLIRKCTYSRVHNDYVRIKSSGKHVLARRIPFVFVAAASDTYLCAYE